MDPFTQLRAFYEAEEAGKEAEAREALNRLELYSYLIENPEETIQ